jgi:hypothetical protein
MAKSLKTRVRAVGSVVGAVVWRGFGLFLFIAGGAAGTGAIVTGSWIDGIVIAWLTLMLGVIGAIGYAIATTGEATPDVVAKASQDAVQKASDKSSK